MKKILVFGGAGLVGSKFITLFDQTFNIKSPSISEVDILNTDQLKKVVQDFNPDTIINFAAFTQVEEAENQNGDKGGICYLINAVGAKNVADVCKSLGKHLIHISTEYVFDGTKQIGPYKEEDKPNPINWYGVTKYFGEQFVLGNGCLSTIVRISMPFSSHYELKKDVARFFLEQLRMGNQIKAIEDQRITPTLVDDIANALKVILDTDTLGFYHVCSKTDTSPLEFVKLIATAFNLDSSQITPVLLDKYNENKKAKLLRFSWLDSSKFSNQFGEEILHTAQEGVRLFKLGIK